MNNNFNQIHKTKYFRKTPQKKIEGTRVQYTYLNLAFH